MCVVAYCNWHAKIFVHYLQFCSYDFHVFVSLNNHSYRIYTYHSLFMWHLRVFSVCFLSSFLCCPCFCVLGAWHDRLLLHMNMNVTVFACLYLRGFYVWRMNGSVVTYKRNPAAVRTAVPTVPEPSTLLATKRNIVELPNVPKIGSRAAQSKYYLYL